MNLEYQIWSSSYNLFIIYVDSHTSTDHPLNIWFLDSRDLETFKNCKTVLLDIWLKNNILFSVSERT